MSKDLMEKIKSLAKRRGFVYQNSEIYGGLANTWDYGPRGAELKRNIKQAWWEDVVWSRPDVWGLDSAIFMDNQVWKASGHLEEFHDPLIDCKTCNSRFREDKLIENSDEDDISEIQCPKCGNIDWTQSRPFNLMFQTHFGPTEKEGSEVYLRPETAQGIFANFKNIIKTMRVKLPFGIAQIGKAFRNEITTGHFLFRTREFEQMEIEYFVDPDDEEEIYNEWLEQRKQWYLDLGIDEDNLRLREHGDDELAHYAKAAEDVEYDFPFGWGEIEGIASRTDFDLKQHQEKSGKDLKYRDDEGNEFLPYVIEPSAGVDRALFAFLADAYTEEEVDGDERTVLKLHPRLAPTKMAIFPLVDKPEVSEVAEEIFHDLLGDYSVMYDASGSIGKRYRRQDEAGTPYCLTVDFDGLEDDPTTVTIRDRDSMEQVRISKDEVRDFLQDNL